MRGECTQDVPAAMEQCGEGTGDFMNGLVNSFSEADLSIHGQKRDREQESQNELECGAERASKRCRIGVRRVQFAEESKMKLIPRLSELEMDVCDDKLAGSEDETVEVLACGVVEDGSTTTFEVKHPEEMFVKTKEDDGPSAENVATQALVVGLIERKLSGASAVVDHLRSTIRKKAQFFDGDQQPAGVCDHEHNAAPEPCGPPSSPCSKMSGEDEDAVFAKVVSRMQVLIDRIEARGRATLLPSTAQIGPPFVPALKFLQRAIRTCTPKQPPTSAPASASAVMVH
eukprot:CAMPEP_0196719156 /NCGR_PEP_ID=MMETSP1091-20130531/2215_1 /TAXON_ID=302021 /ORGANISM="Rhodomonas sp., Strain CCMP768" /LENGTH=285 /DNA_ID=CAMNT_0042060043 /DNA_START=211 /DNA_END=1068 /DNA_ORIENTATION=+